MYYKLINDYGLVSHSSTKVTPDGRPVAVDGVEDRCRMSDAVVDVLGNSRAVWSAV